MQNSITALSRDCKVTEIPSGEIHILAAGTPVIITQSLGGSYTVTTGYSGQLLRIDAADADVLGYEVQKPAAVESGEFTEEAVWDQMKLVYDPEIPVNIVDLGLVYTCNISEIEGGQHNIDITMSMTAPGCGMGDVLKEDVESKLHILPTVKDVNVEIVFDPVWGPEMMSEATRLSLGMDV